MSIDPVVFALVESSPTLPSSVAVLPPASAFAFTGELSLHCLVGAVACMGSLIEPPAALQSHICTPTTGAPDPAAMDTGASASTEPPDQEGLGPEEPLCLYSPLSHSLLCISHVPVDDGRDAESDDFLAVLGRICASIRADPSLDATPWKRLYASVLQTLRQQYELNPGLPKLPPSSSVVVLESRVSSVRAALQAQRAIPPLYGDESSIPSNAMLPLHVSSAAGVKINLASRAPFFKLDESWAEVARSLCEFHQSSGKTPVFINCGAKDVGKSTLSRFLINALLSNFPAVAFLESDPGQSEFTPPGLVSLSIVRSRVFGPSFTHMKEPELAFFIGDTSAKSDPSLFLQAVMSLVDAYRTSFSVENGAPVPLIVNTHGWIKGIGLDLILDIMCYTRPTHIAQFFTDTPSKNLPIINEALLSVSVPRMLADSSVRFPPLAQLPTIFPLARPIALGASQSASQDDPPAAEPAPGHSSAPVANHALYSSHTIRAAQLSAYFLTLHGKRAQLCRAEEQGGTADDDPPSDTPSIVDSLLSVIPYSVPWRSVHICIMHSEVPYSQVLFALNGSVVGLGVARGRYEKALVLRPIPPAAATKSRVGIPTVLASPSAVPCVGLGIVRGIDAATGTLYISTPLSLDALQAVNVVMKGSLELPMHLFVKDATSHSPYIASVFSSMVTGSQNRKARKNLQRRKND